MDPWCSREPVTDLADELDIKRATTDYGNHIVRDVQGRIVDEDDLPDDFEVVTSIEHEYAADRAELSPQADDEGEEFGGGDVLFPNGYSALIQGLDTGFQVNLGAEVDLVDTTGPSVGVHTADEIFAAEAVLSHGASRRAQGRHNQLCARVESSHARSDRPTRHGAPQQGLSALPVGLLG